MSEAFFLTREELSRAFDSPRAVRQFEEMQERVSTSATTLESNVAATEAMQGASYVTLSPNAELPNEYVLAAGPGISLSVSGNQVVIDSAARVTGGTASFTVIGDTDVVLPLTGVLATRGNAETLANKTLAAPLFAGLTNAADDAAAAAAGVPVNGGYRNGSVFMVRVA